MKQISFNRPLSILFTAVLLALTLTACQTTGTTQSTTKPTVLLHAYDYQIIDSKTEHPLSVNQLASQLIDYDVIFIGEFHGNHASHLLEIQLISSLYQQREEQVISLEMFNRNQQAILNRYLDSEIGEVYLIKKAPAWNNYTASYRPIVEHAKQNFIPVIASNAAADIVRCIGREGKLYLSKLSEQESDLIAKSPFIDNDEYRQRYMDFLKEAKSLDQAGKERSYLAQLTRDNTMAESIYQAKVDNPSAQVIHLNGSFHSDAFLGTVAALKQRQPDLKIAVVSPISIENPSKPSYSAEDLKSGDYIYLIQSQPEQYQDAAYRSEIHQAMFKKSKAAKCK